jgi:hypothetical protein
VTHSYVTSAVLPQFLLDKDRQRHELRFQVSTNFLRFFCAKFHVHTFGRIDCFVNIILRRVALRSSFDNINFVAVYLGLDIRQTAYFSV